ncbi:ubiquinone biosynthesis monooxygenase COQ6, mitochondrial-like isoform X2 [Homarus americanus]|uniref:ubiquinone biosynthesis monooxygenase COQ6, mitochondrial-like isoform X2 n=1 Tax=Homarus americanus TaxID=6706 RepID=UPI001C482BEA|nr:ubiquinone biosynthesis monooxygenase COQ6, mitochondrial-like isoform X2 [Homarus americanus]
MYLSSRLSPLLRASRHLVRREELRGRCITCKEEEKREKRGEVEHYDVVVSGGGMVGLAMASSLGQNKTLSDRRILLLEGTPNKPWKLPEEFTNRVCALSGHTQKLFRKLGIWGHIEGIRAQAVRRMQVWEACSEAMITFDEHDQSEVLAHIVENDVILHALKEQVPAHVEVEYNTKVKCYDLPSDLSSRVTVCLHDGRKVSADLLIGADGAKSLVRQTMGSQYLGWEYDQMGIVATLQLSELSNDRSSLVWSTTKEQAQKLHQLTDEEFTDALNRAIWDESSSNEIIRTVHERWMTLLETIAPRSGAAVRQLPPSVCAIVPGTRGSFPLGLGHAVHYVAPRVALIGDAAHRIHPLAGQGVNLGFGDVATLTDTLQNAVLIGADIGDEQILHQYESERQRHNVATLATIDGLYRLYNSTAPPLVLLRSLGLSAVNIMAPLKRQLMAHAEG